MNIVIEPKEDKPVCIPQRTREWGEQKTYMKSKGWVKKKDLMEHLQKPRHGVGFSHFHVDMEAVYICVCGFQGVFASTRCARCGRAV